MKGYCHNNLEFIHAQALQVTETDGTFVPCAGRTRARPWLRAAPQDLPLLANELVRHGSDPFSFGSIKKPCKDNVFVLHPQSTPVTQTSAQFTAQVSVSFVSCRAPKKTQ